MTQFFVDICKCVYVSVCKILAVLLSATIFEIQPWFGLLKIMKNYEWVIEHGPVAGHQWGVKWCDMCVVGAGCIEQFSKKKDVNLSA